MGAGPHQQLGSSTAQASPGSPDRGIGRFLGQARPQPSQHRHERLRVLGPGDGEPPLDDEGRHGVDLEPRASASPARTSSPYSSPASTAAAATGSSPTDSASAASAEWIGDVAALLEVRRA